jgi:hypothetical protein
MRIRLLHMTLVAVIAPACLCAAQDGRQDNSQGRPEDHLLLQEALRLFTLDPDSYVIVFPNRVIVRSGRSIVQDGRSEPMLELICEGRTVELHERAAATHDLYLVPDYLVPDGFCATLPAAFGPRDTGGRR